MKRAVWLAAGVCVSLVGLGVVALAEVGPEPVVGGEADVVRRGHNHPGHGAALDAAHAIRQHRLGDPAEGFQFLKLGPGEP